jgi:para-nitrobenzyl esterase
MYYFDQFDPERPLFGGPGAPRPRGANHATEMQYVFATPWMPFTEGDEAVSKAMHSYWVNFIKYGDPNGDGLDPWPEYRDGDRTVMKFRDGTSLIETPHKPQLLLLEEYFEWRRNIQ